MDNQYQEIKNIINRSGNILVISHRKPDADTLGAALTLKIWLTKIGKQVTLACVDEPAPVFSFLPHIDEFVDEFDLKSFDLAVIVDAGASYMTNFHLKYEDLFKGIVPILNIDHHASNDYFGKINVVDPKAASTTVILYRILTATPPQAGLTKNVREANTNQSIIDNDMATCLLAGIYGDTGSFMHSNTNKEVYEVSSDLMAKGARVTDITRALFKSKPLATLRLWGRVLEKAKITNDNIVMSAIKEEDYEQASSSPEHLSGVVDYLNMIPGTKFAVLLNEDRNGHVKGSFRTREADIDLSRIAAVFGGGGHPKASGFMLPGKLAEELKYTIISPDSSRKSLEF